MDFYKIHIHQLIDERVIARENKDWKFSDKIRDYLDTKFTFIIDTPNGQEVYFRNKGTRKELINEIKKDIKANELWESWLFSMQESAKVLSKLIKLNNGNIPK